MRLTAVFATLLLTAIPAFAGAVEEVRQAEIAFAKAFADRDAAKFFAFVADDATFLAGLSTATGKKQVVESWTRYFNGPAPFVWGPDRVSVSADGTLGLSTGPIYVQGQHAGDYISTWRKTDGAWKVVFDSNGPGAAPLASHFGRSFQRSCIHTHCSGTRRICSSISRVMRAARAVGSSSRVHWKGSRMRM